MARSYHTGYCWPGKRPKFKVCFPLNIHGFCTDIKSNYYKLPMLPTQKNCRELKTTTLEIYMPNWTIYSCQLSKKLFLDQAQWYVSVVPAYLGDGQEDHLNPWIWGQLGNIMRPVSKKQNKILPPFLVIKHLLFGGFYFKLPAYQGFVCFTFFKEIISS